MKVLLVKPYNLSDHIQPSLGLGYLATAIRDQHQVSILDGIKERVKPSQLVSYLQKNLPDVVGFQFYTFDQKFIKEYLRVVKEVNSRIVTLVGGPHPSALPEETMDSLAPDLDFAFKGEAEVGLPLLLEQVSGLGKTRNIEKLNPEALEKIPGLVWRNNHRVKINSQIFVENLDNFGFPSWDLINPQKYPPAQHGAFFKNFPIAPIITTRGCPFRCTFCAGHLISGRKTRFRSAEHVLEEIKILYHDYGIREIHIVDDNFTLNPTFVRNFCKQLIKADLKISWAVPNGIRVDTLDEELLSLMKGSGLYLISLGIESGSDRILKLMKKNLTTDMVRQKIKLARRVGLDVAGFFILGFPGETREEMERTIDFSLSLDLIRANFFTYLPFPGTESYQMLLKNGQLRKVNWDNFSFTSAPYVPPPMTHSELRRLQKQAFIKFFFLRPRIIIRNLKGIKSFYHFKFLFRRLIRWVISR